MNENVSKFNNTVSQLLVNLAGRWQDEKQYEDINDYQKRLQTEATKFGITLTGMTKRPFGCKFTYEGNAYTVQAKLKRTSANVVTSWVKA